MSATEFPSGFFFIRNKHKKLVVDVKMGSMELNASVLIWRQKPSDSMNQLWFYEDGFLINKKSGLVLDIRGGDVKSHKTLIQYARKVGLADNQRWSYADGHIFSTIAPHLVLDIKDGVFKEGSEIILSDKNPSSSTQQWILEAVDNDLCKEQLALLRPDQGPYTSQYPGPNELYLCYKHVYLDQKPPTPEQIVGAAAFMGLKKYVSHQKEIQEPYSTPTSKAAIERHVKEEMTKLTEEHQIKENGAKLLSQAKSAAIEYFDREYGFELPSAV